MFAAEPVLILTVAQSYSTLTGAMLGQHPQLYDLLETQLFEIDWMREWWAEYGEDNHEADGLIRVVAEVVLGHQCRETVKEAREWLWRRRSKTSAEVLHELGERLYPLRIIEGSPIEGASDQEVQRKLRRRLLAFPCARFLHLVCHPRSNGILQLEGLKARSQNSSDSARIARRCARLLESGVLDPQVLWYRVNQNIHRFLADVAPRQQMRIRGEDLLAERDTQLIKIANWLGLSCKPDFIEAMEHPETSPFAFIGPPGAPFGGDPSFLRYPTHSDSYRTVESGEGPVRRQADGFGFGLEVRLLARLFGYN
jgi:hypothetical protein